jgi:hypothetical protein
VSLETWICPSSTGSRSGPIVGPGDPSPDINRTPDPWTCLRFQNGLLTIDTEDEHYPEWRKWLDYSASGSGLRIISDEELRSADPNAIACPDTIADDTNLTGTHHVIRGTAPCPFRALTIREVHAHQIAVHAHPKGQ